jgi:hypothetical protein
MKERFQIYRLAVPDIPAGQGVVGLPLKLDSDAPFTCRSLSFVNADGGNAGNDAYTLVRFKGPNGMYRQAGAVPASQMVPSSVQTAWRRMYPETTWPANATIEIDITNASGVTLSGMVVLFRGVKQFADSVDVPGSSVYPATFGSIPFDLPRYVTLQEVQILDNIALNGPPDAAVVLRGGLFTYANSAALVASSYRNLFCSIEDVNHKPYMNSDVEVDYLFGNTPPNMQLWFPQIWLPASGILYYRFSRNDVGFGVLNMCLTWKGSKVFPK